MSGLPRLVLSCLVAAGAAPALSQAADYRSEVSLDFDHAEFDAPGAPAAQDWTLAGTYYFEPVSIDGLPLSEAAFLRRSSFVNAGWVRAELGDEKIDVLAANVGYYLPGTIFYGRLGFAYLDDFAGDQTQVTATLGVAPLDGLLVTTNFSEDGWDPNVTARYVGKLPNSHFFAASVSALDPDVGSRSLGVDFDYFLDDTFSVGAGFDSGPDRWSARTEKFFNPAFSIGARISAGDEGEEFGATLKWRF